MATTDYSKPYNRITRAVAIRRKCIDCMAGQAAEVRKCPIVTCSLWRYRMGREVRDEKEAD
jgi:hypothetical protein